MKLSRMQIWFNLADIMSKKPYKYPQKLLESCSTHSQGVILPLLQKHLSFFISLVMKNEFILNKMLLLLLIWPQTQAHRVTAGHRYDLVVLRLGQKLRPLWVKFPT